MWQRTPPRSVGSTWIEEPVRDFWGDPEMSKGDIIVLGSLAGVFCWTYIVLPLVFYHS
jgi:hypothetical protein